jgi:arylsulfatase A-like enzyme
MTMNFTSLSTAFTALVASVALSCAPAQAKTSSPNIILVMPDDVSYGDYARLGNPIMRTPSVDAFKKEALLFTQFKSARRARRPARR